MSGTGCIHQMNKDSAIPNHTKQHSRICNTIMDKTHCTLSLLWVSTEFFHLCIPQLGVLNRKRGKKKEGRKMLGQYNSNSKLIRWQNTSRYKFTTYIAHTHMHTRTHTHTTQQVKWCNLQKKVERVQTWLIEAWFEHMSLQGSFKQWLTSHNNWSKHCTT